MSLLEIATVVLILIAVIWVRRAVLSAAHRAVHQMGDKVREGTARRNDWGIDRDPVNCPRCHVPVLTTRAPRTFKQVLWGGWTCAECGCVMDKWGHELPR